MSDERTNRTFYLVEVQHDELSRPYSLDADAIKGVLVEGTNVHRSRPVIASVAEVERSFHWKRGELTWGPVAETSGPGWPD